jgi:hypothetical protein
MKIVKVYIASPYSIGDQALNVRRSLKAADELLDNGLFPFCPLLSHFWHMMYPRQYESWMLYDLEWLKTCDAVLRLPGESKGASREEEMAKLNNIPVYYSVNEILRKVKNVKI